MGRLAVALRQRLGSGAIVNQPGECAWWFELRDMPENSNERSLVEAVNPEREYAVMECCGDTVFTKIVPLANDSLRLKSRVPFDQLVETIATENLKIARASSLMRGFA